MDFKGPQTTKTSLKIFFEKFEKKERLIPSDFKTYYKATEVKTV